MEVHIGTSGWSYKEWKGAFYPKELKQTDWLRHYAGIFDTTEINSSFYHMPKEKTVEGWVEKVPDNFLFCPKLTKYITHTKKLKDCEEPLEYFFNTFSAMKKKMGPVLIQLPPSLKFDQEKVAEFFALLDTYKQHDFALEARHDSWNDDKVFSLMKEHNVAWVISQSGAGFPYAEALTAKHVYVRFHGPGKLYVSSYSKEQLASYAEKFSNWAKGKHSLWAYFNNTMEGAAIDNTYMLKELLTR